MWTLTRTSRLGAFIASTVIHLCAAGATLAMVGYLVVTGLRGTSSVQRAVLLLSLGSLFCFVAASWATSAQKLGFWPVFRVRTHSGDRGRDVSSSRTRLIGWWSLGIFFIGIAILLVTTVI